jgi:hypothetical protein
MRRADIERVAQAVHKHSDLDTAIAVQQGSHGYLTHRQNSASCVDAVPGRA